MRPVRTSHGVALCRCEEANPIGMDARLDSPDFFQRLRINNGHIVCLIVGDVCTRSLRVEDNAAWPASDWNPLDLPMPCRIND